MKHLFYVARHLAVGGHEGPGATATQRWRVSAGRSPIALDHRIQDTSGNFSLLREKDQKDAIALLEGESFAPSLPTEHLN